MKVTRNLLAGLLSKKFKLIQYSSILLILHFLSLSAVAQVQTMAIPAGAVVEFATTLQQASELVRAFCMHRGRETPTMQADFDNFAGRVKLTYSNGSTVTKDISNAPEISIKGAGSYEHLKVVRNDPNIRSVEFIDDGLAHAGTAEDFARVRAALPKISPHLSTDEEAEPIWRYEWKVNRAGEGKDKTVVLDHILRDPNNTLVQEVLNINSRGDAIVLAMPSGKKILIDTGEGKSAFDQILPNVTNSVIKPNAEPLDLILTHQDRDHLGNALGLITDKSVYVDNILFSDIGLDTQLKLAFLAKLNEFGYSREILPGTSISVFRRPGGRRLEVHAKTLVPGLNADALNVRVFTVDADPNVKVNIFQLTDPTKSNSGSIITEVAHNGYTTLYLGDADTRALAALTDFSEQQQDAINNTISDRVISLFRRKFPQMADELNKRLESLLQSQSPDERDFGREILERVVLKRAEELGIKGEFEKAIDNTFNEIKAKMVLRQVDAIKWPHHAWLPRVPREQNILHDFLVELAPTRVILSSDVPEITGQSVTRVQTFIRETLGADVEVYVTGTDGHVKELTLLRWRQRESLDSSSSGAHRILALLG